MGAGEDEQAETILTEWATKAPQDIESLKTLLQLATKRESADGILIASARLALAQEGQEQVDAALILAETALAEARAAEAKDALTAVHEAQPGVEKVTEQLEAVYTKTESVAPPGRALHGESWSELR